MNFSQLNRLTELEEENNKLMKLYAYISLQNHALKDLIEKKAVVDNPTTASLLSNIILSVR